MSLTLNLQFYGLSVQLDSSSTELLDYVRRDFWFFQTEHSPADLLIRAYLEPPDYQALPDLPCSKISPRNLTFKDGGKKFLDYFGKGLLIEDSNQIKAFSENLDFLREMLYLLLLSKVGLHLDRSGLHRLHAAGLLYNGKAVLLLCPSGGGKSTTAFQLLQTGDYGLISEDSPVVDTTGNIHPFPLCLGCKGQLPEGIPEKFVRRVQRMEFDPKSLIDLEYFEKSLVRESVEPGLVFLGLRHSGPTAQIEEISATTLFRALFRDLVVGMGIYQGVEFLFSSGPTDLLRHSAVMVSRFRAAYCLAKKSQAYLFRMGCDLDKNIRTLDSFIRSQKLR